MKTLFCKHCHKEVSFIVEKKLNNNVAFCTNCGCFIKNVPNSFLGIYTTGNTFPFGKYKGTKIKDCEDAKYMHWFIDNVELNDSLKIEIFERISELKSII
jgi:transcription initiation factor TFIIIB Brf1 subunit/transcription initiation factor TFIIB